MNQDMKLLTYLMFGMRSGFETELIFSALSALCLTSGASGITGRMMRAKYGFGHLVSPLGVKNP